MPMPPDHEDQVLCRALVLESMEVMRDPLLDYIKRSLTRDDDTTTWEERARTCFNSKRDLEKQVAEWDFPLLLRIVLCRELNTHFFVDNDRTQRETLKMDVDDLKRFRNFPAHDWPVKNSFLKRIVGRGKSFFATLGIQAPVNMLVELENRSSAKPHLDQWARVQQASYYFREAFHGFVVDTLAENEHRLNKRSEFDKSEWGWETWGKHIIYNQGDAGRPADEWDSSGLFKLLNYYWGPFFRQVLSRTLNPSELNIFRGYVSELEPKRNEWAHKPPSFQDSFLVLNSIQKVILLFARSTWFKQQDTPKPVMDWVEAIQRDMEKVRELESEIQQGYTDGVYRLGTQLRNDVLAEVIKKVRPFNGKDDLPFKGITIQVFFSNAVTLEKCRSFVEQPDRAFEKHLRKHLASEGFHAANRINLQCTCGQAAGSAAGEAFWSITTQLDPLDKLERMAQLKVIRGKANKVKYRLVPGKSFNLGRYPTVESKNGRWLRKNDIFFLDPTLLDGDLQSINSTISRRHGRIQYDTDLDCFVYINEDGNTSIQRKDSNEIIQVKLQHVALRDGDTLLLGNAYVRFNEVVKEA